MSNKMKSINILNYKTELDKLKKNSEKDIRNHDYKVNRTTKQLEELLKERETQKTKLETISKQKNITKGISNSFNHDQINPKKCKTKLCVMSDDYHPIDTHENNDDYPIISDQQDNNLHYASENENNDPPLNHLYNNDSNSNDIPINFLNKDDTPINFTNNNDDVLINYLSSNDSNKNIVSNEKSCGYMHIWDAYWPFIGSGETGPCLNIGLNYITFNGILIEKWNTNLSTPPTTVFPTKDLFKFDLVTNKCTFNFNFKFENMVTDDKTIININPESTIHPFHLNQYIVIKDPNITTPDISSTDILAIIGYYNTYESYLNQFTETTDNFDIIKNLFMSTQLFFMHVNQIKDDVKLIISRDTNLGENLFKVYIETDAKIEIKETLVPLSIDSTISDIGIIEIVILQRTIYVNGKYFMTYANYINDISAACQLGNMPGFTHDARQIPIQLAIMLLFGAPVPIINLDTFVGNTDHECLFIRLYRGILKKLIIN